MKKSRVAIKQPPLSTRGKKGIYIDQILDKASAMSKALPIFTMHPCLTLIGHKPGKFCLWFAIGKDDNG